MKNFKRITAVVLAFVIIALTLPTFSVFAADSDMRYGRTKLTANQQYVYDALASGIKDAKAEISINISGKNIDLNNDLKKIVELVYMDYPEYFWFMGGFGASYDGTTLVVQPPYSMTGSTLSSAKSAYNSKVSELTSGLSGKSDYEKSKILHDRLCDAVKYTSTTNDQNAYGALVEGEAVCNGYARAYQHLMLEAGIPAWFVRGSSINPSTGSPEGHAWNIVKLDGKWYYTDVTWDDQGDSVFYEYLNITTDKMDDDHTLDSFSASLVPTASSTAANYYKVEGREFTSYDQTKLVNLLKKDNNKTQIYINGNVNSFLNSVGSNLLSIGSQLGGTGAYSVSYSASMLKNAIIINVVVISENHTHKTKTTYPQVNATCLSNGKKAYYVCDCGMRFLDNACTQEVTSDDQLTIPAKAHTPSGWKNDATNHWKECTVCGNETANTKANHTDKNKDNKCDTCGYALPIADESGNIVIGGGTSASDISGTTSTESKPTTPNTNSTTSTPSADASSETDATQSTEENTDATVSEDETLTEESTTTTGTTNSETDETDETDEDTDGIGVVGIITIIAAAIVAIGVTTFIIIRFKKN